MTSSNIETPHALSASVGAFVDELVRSGVRHFCVCPGSRSTPLALTIARHPAAKLWMHLDERSASFFALGQAKVLREPVALICTSGTAAANFLPAVVEAFYARVPLIIVTADRPHELRDVGAPQTINQINLFGTHAKWFVDLAEPDAAPGMLRYTRTVAARAVTTARRGPAGPVHINFPFREPLLPKPAEALAAPEARADERPYVSVATGARAPDAAHVAALAATLADAPRGLIVCGPQDDPHLAASVTRLAEALGYPILADPLSGLRNGPHDHALVLDSYDAFLRDAAFVERFAPQVVLRFGAMPVSKPLLLYLQRHAQSRMIVVDGDGGWNEPTLLADEMIHADARLLCEALLSQTSTPLRTRTSAWLSSWQMAERNTRAAISAYFAQLDELFEGKVFAELAALLPAGTQVYAGNSMPIRDMDTFFAGDQRPMRLLGNRGANGIDGVVSSALGAATASSPTVLVIGDLSFYHDANGLLAAKHHHLDLTIILLNNDGGGIFSFLPQASEPDHFETLFGTPHGLDFRPLAEMYGAHYQRIGDWQGFRAALQHSLQAGGLQIIEVPTTRDRNVALHREIWPLVSASLHEVIRAEAE